jgi:hypothetical protein
MNTGDITTSVAHKITFYQFTSGINFGPSVRDSEKKSLVQFFLSIVKPCPEATLLLPVKEHLPG